MYNCICCINTFNSIRVVLGLVKTAKPQPQIKPQPKGFRNVHFATKNKSQPMSGRSDYRFSLHFQINRTRSNALIVFWSRYDEEIAEKKENLPKTQLEKKMKETF